MCHCMKKKTRAHWHLLKLDERLRRLNSRCKHRQWVRRFRVWRRRHGWKIGSLVYFPLASWRKVKSNSIVYQSRISTPAKGLNEQKEQVRNDMQRSIVSETAAIITSIKLNVKTFTFTLQVIFVNKKPHSLLMIKC